MSSLLTVTLVAAFAAEPDPTDAPAQPADVPATDAAAPAGPDADAGDDVGDDATDDEAIEEVTVIGRSEQDTLARSAQAVTVVDTATAQQQSADLGEVLARTSGVSIRRSGGLGSDGRFTLNGLTDEQIRFFLDGVPLDLLGWPTGLSNVPVDLVSRVEVYKGVVPIRFGADALGGAVNLVSEGDARGVGGSLSYQGGSFDTHRLAGHLHALAPKSGLRIRTGGFFDTSRNDYAIDVEVPDEQGRLSPATVRRFHDGYRSGGGSVEVAAVDRSWADELSVRVFGNSTMREIQNNVVMTVPYGEPVSRTDTVGELVRYAYQINRSWHVDALVGHAWTRRGFTDTGACVYDWFGRCIRERATPGEISTPATDQLVWDHALVARAGVQWRYDRHHQLSLTVAPTWFTRTGDDLLDDGSARDPLTAQRDALQIVSGLEHQLDAWHERIQNLVFVKQYTQVVSSEEPITGGGFRDADRTTARFGVGDGFRLALTDDVWLKVSYEWATRLPAPEEIFGDAVLVIDNLELVPETSHNVNLGLTADVQTRGGAVRANVDGFLRQAKDLIVLLGNDRMFSYFNVFGARSVGVDAAVGWTSVGDWVSLDVNASWLDLRNVADEGTFGDFAGDRIPNRPWLHANAALQLGASNVAVQGDRLTLDSYTRYVHPFLRGWESIGLREFKQEVPAQLSQTLALTYAVDTGAAPQHPRLHVSVEVSNLTDADLFDFFGVQRPGRAVSAKVGAAW